MKTLLLVLVLAAAVLPGAARAGYCSPITCAPSQFSLAGGDLLGFRASSEKPVNVVDLASGETRWTVPAGPSGGKYVVHLDGLRLDWYDASRGELAWTVTLPAQGRLAGVSQDGLRAVVLRVVGGDHTEVAVVSRTGTRTLRVAGKAWDFDALRGDKLFLVKYLAGGAYQIRLAHLGSGRVEGRPLKDPHESGTIWGSAYSRVSSADGRYLFTLYIAQNGASMVHALDLAEGTARCIDLPGTGDFMSATSWALVVSPDARLLWAVGPGYKRAVTIDVRARKVTGSFRIDLPSWAMGGGTRAALSPDGRRIALTDGESVAELNLRTHKLSRESTAAVAVGYSRGGKLWKLR
jgi:hypothetical protein